MTKDQKQVVRIATWLASSLCGTALVVFFVLQLPEKEPPPDDHPSQRNQSDGGSGAESGARKPGGRKSYAPEMLAERHRKYSMSEEVIRRKHERLLLRPIPDYGFALRGYDANGAIWVFNVPLDKKGDFERYLTDLGVPPDGISEEKFVAGLRTYPDLKEFETLTEKDTSLIYHSTIPMPSAGETYPDDYGIDEQNHDSLTYHFLNPFNREIYASMGYYPGNGSVIVVEQGFDRD